MIALRAAAWRRQFFSPLTCSIGIAAVVSQYTLAPSWVVTLVVCVVLSVVVSVDVRLDDTDAEREDVAVEDCVVDMLELSEVVSVDVPVVVAVDV